jgi:Ca2+-binding RTX toxin-like protein
MKSVGTSGNDILYGGVGDDTLIGGDGADRLYGYGRPRGAIDLDGSGDRIVVAASTSLDITTNLTVEAWVRLDGAQPTFSTLVAKGDWGYQIRMSALHPGAIEFISGTPGAPVRGVAAISTTHLDTGVWYHVAGVVDGNQQRIYINGQLEGTTARGSTTVTTNDFDLWIGGNEEMSGRDFNGAISDVRIWSLARSASEIANSMHSTLAGSEPGLRGNWVLDSAAGPYGEDQSPNGNDGLVIGNPGAADFPGIGDEGGNDVLHGGAGNDVLRGGTGNDWFDAGYGVRDVVYGGSGHDRLRVNLEGVDAGTSVVMGDGSVRSIRDGLSNTLVFSEIEERDVTGGSGNDVLRGGAWNDVLRGGAGDDWFDAGYGVRDVVYGGSGHDRLRVNLEGVDAGTSVVMGDGSVRSIRDGLSNTLVFSEIEERDVTGGGGNDVLRGGAWNDVLRGGAGDDWFDAGYGVRDVVYGGSGHDRLRVNLEGVDAGTSVVMGDGSVRSIRDGLSNTLVFSEIEERDVTGGGGNDVLRGGAWNDVLRGGAGDDWFDAGYGVRDVVYGGSGHDRLRVNLEGVDAGTSVVMGDGSVRSIRDGLSNTLVFSEIEERDVTGGGGNDVLRGGAWNDVLRGGAGDDWFDAGYGVRDVVYGGSGHDRLRVNLEGVDAGTSVVMGDGSVRSIRDGLSNTLVFSEIEERDVTGGGGNDVLRGGAWNDVLRGGAGDDWFDAGYGVRDVVYGGSGHDRLRVNLEGVDAGTSVVMGDGSVRSIRDGLSNTLVFSEIEERDVTGGSGNDVLRGGAWNDILRGGLGEDLLTGGLGNDVLTGGAGEDQFLFNFAPNSTSNLDRITDFNVADDTIVLENAIFKAFATTGAIASGAFHIGTKANDTNDRLIYDQATGGLFYDSNGSASGGSVQIADLSAGLSLTYNDFLIV